MSTKKPKACDMNRAFRDYQYARRELIRFGVAYEYIADSPFPTPPKKALLQALQDGALLACAVTNQDGAHPTAERRVIASAIALAKRLRAHRGRALWAEDGQLLEAVDKLERTRGRGK